MNISMEQPLSICTTTGLAAIAIGRGTHHSLFGVACACGSAAFLVRQVLANDNANGWIGKTRAFLVDEVTMLSAEYLRSWTLLHMLAMTGPMCCSVACNLRSPGTLSNTHRHTLLFSGYRRRVSGFSEEHLHIRTYLVATKRHDYEEHPPTKRFGREGMGKKLSVKKASEMSMQALPQATET